MKKFLAILVGVLSFALSYYTVSRIFLSPERRLAELEQGVAEMRSTLPQEVEGTGVTLVDATLADTMVVYRVTLSPEAWEVARLMADEANSDPNLERVLACFPDVFVQMCIDCGVGIRYNYVAEETGEPLMSIEMNADKMAEIRARLARGI